jgi:hypothetical protein
LILISAVLDGEKFNRESRKWNFLSICDSDSFQYQSKDDRFPWYTFRISEYDAEMSVGSYTYKRMTKFPWETMSSLFRDAYDGIHSYFQDKDVLLLPADATIGTIFGSLPRSIVIDTATVYRHGSLRRQITARYRITDFEREETWLEGIGMVKSFEYSLYRIYTDTLIWASVCGSEFGELRDVEAAGTDVNLSLQLHSNYPNPFADETSVSFLLRGTAPAQAQLTLYNALGAEVKVVYEGELPPGEHTLRIGREDCPPGVYFCRLRVGDETVLRKMIRVP